MSKYVKLVETGVAIIITRHSEEPAVLIAPEDLDRLKKLLDLLSKRAEARLKLAKDKLTSHERETKEIADLVKRALRETVEGDNTLLHEMARKYLGL